MKLRKILAFSLVILSLAAMFALPISANTSASDIPKVFIYKYYTLNGVAVPSGVVDFDSTNTNYTMTLLCDDLGLGNISFSFDSPDESQYINVSDLILITGFSMIAYGFSFDSSPTYPFSYAAGEGDVVSLDLNTGFARNDWILQIFIDDIYRGSDGITGNPWDTIYDPDVTVPPVTTYDPPYDWGYIDDKYSDIEDKINSYNTDISLETSSPEDVGDFILHFGGNDEIFDFYEPTVLAPVSYIIHSPYVLLFLVIVFTFALVAYILFGKRG